MHELLPGYVLGILDSDEKQLIQEYLATNSDGWEQISALDETISYLAYYAPPVALPKESKERVLSYVQTQIIAAPFKTTNPLTQIVAPTSAVAVPTHPPKHASHIFPQVGHNNFPFWTYILSRFPPNSLKESGSRWHKWWSYAFTWKIYSIAATGAVVLLTLLFNQTQSIITQTNAQLALAEETNAQLQQMAESYDRQLDILRAQVERSPSFASSSIQQTVSMQGTERFPQASGTLLAGSQGGYLILTGLAPLQDNQTYQLWLIPKDEAAISSGLIALPPSQPVAIIEVDLSLDVDSYAGVGLSIEPAGGSRTPTTEAIVLFGSLT